MINVWSDGLTTPMSMPCRGQILLQSVDRLLQAGHGVKSRVTRTTTCLATQTHQHGPNRDLPQSCLCIVRRSRAAIEHSGIHTVPVPLQQHRPWRTASCVPRIGLAMAARRPAADSGRCHPDPPPSRSPRSASVSAAPFSYPPLLDYTPRPLRRVSLVRWLAAPCASRRCPR